jgi:uncharacterized protein YeaO (DUF488 family)
VDIRLKRAYEPASPADGYRVLVDRLWPRGVSRQRAMLDDWQKELAPSTERSRLAALRRRARDGALTLVYSARDAEHNDAIVLADVLRRGLPSSEARR